MSRLHHIQVRRARGLPVPLPPTPKRPLGPPVLFTWKYVPIRTRADAIEASGSWDAFLDEMIAYRFSEHRLTIGTLDLVERLVPPAERQAHREDLRRRAKALMQPKDQAQQASARRPSEGMEERRRGFRWNLFRRAA